MANTLNLGDGNWGVKDSSLLGYAKDNTKFVPETFDVTRASGGTRVNKDGLIETPAELGSEEVVNGDFATDSDWGKQAGWTISGGSANSNNGGSYKSISQSGMPFQVGKSYKVSCEVSNYVSGGIVFNVGGFNLSQVFTENGVHTQIIQASNPSTNTYLYIESRASGFEGSVDNVSVVEYNDNNLARIDYTDGADGVLLTEPQSTNFVQDSEDFRNGKWAQVNATTSSEAIISPDGTSGSFLVSPSADSNRHYIWESVSGSVTASFSLFVKAKELSYVQIASGNNTQQFANFDVSNGTVGSVGTNFSNAKIEDYGNGWYRCSAVSNSQYNSFYISVIQSSTSAWLGVWNPANNTDGLYVWGAQVEAANAVGYNGEYSTSYILTEGSTVTRNKDEVNNGGDVNSFGSEEGVLYAEIADFATTSSYRLIQISDGSSSNRIYLAYTNANNKIRVVVRVANSDQFDYQYTLTDATEFNKIAFKYKENNFSLWVNGVEVYTDSSGITFPSATLNVVSFSNTFGSENFFGKTKNIQAFNTALSDSDLLSLTTTGSVPYWKQYSAMATSLNYTNK